MKVDPRMGRSGLIAREAHQIFWHLAISLMAAGALFPFGGCTPYAVGEAASIRPERVWTVYDGKAIDEISARVASAFSPGENPAYRIRLFEVENGFLLFVPPQIVQIFGKGRPPDALTLWFLPTAPEGIEWSRTIQCPNGDPAVTSPLAFLGEHEGEAFFMIRCLGSSRDSPATARKPSEWILRVHAKSGEPVMTRVSHSGGLWSVWIHGGYILQSEYTGNETTLKWEYVRNGISGTLRVKGQFGRGWLGKDTGTEWMTGEDGLALLKESASGLSVEQVAGATSAKFGRCSENAVYARVDAERVFIVCLVQSTLYVANAAVGSLEAAELERLGKISPWTDPVFPPEDLTIYEVKTKDFLILVTGQQVFGIDLQTGKVRYALTAKNVGIAGTRVTSFETRPPNRLALRYFEAISGKLLSSLQSDLEKEPLSVLSLLFPVRSGLVVFNLATGDVIFVRGSSLPLEATPVTPLSGY